MSVIGHFFTVILYRPIFNIFVELYNVLGHDVGLVILAITILVRLVLYPLMAQSIRAQKSMMELQPKLEALKIEFKDDQQKIAAATMQLYKEHKVNPLSSCLPMLIQFPILIALYYSLRDALGADPTVVATHLAQNLYSFVHNPGSINHVTLGIFDLGKPSIVLAILAGLAQFVQARAMTRTPAPKNAGEGAKDENAMVAMNKQMMYMMPVLTAFIGMRLQSGLALYWFLSTTFMALQQWIIFRKKKSAASAVITQ